MLALAVTRETLSTVAGLPSTETDSCAAVGATACDADRPSDSKLANTESVRARTSGGSWRGSHRADQGDGDDSSHWRAALRVTCAMAR